MIQTLPSSTASTLLDWYDRHARDLPWRIRPVDGLQKMADPYPVWLSEIMLQQTTVTAVKPYYQKFLSLWPTVADLAGAEDQAVMVAWAGLGYYSRARNLLKCARAVMAEYSGHFPQTAAELQKLPGIGPYTAAAVGAIAFRDPVAVVDGNVERVVTRLLAIDTPLPKAKELVRCALQPIIPQERPGDLAQAFMDLGATLCTPKRPACSLCPLQLHCQAFTGGIPERFPVKLPKSRKPTRKGAAYVLIRDDKQIWLRKRGSSGLLADMTEVPTTNWSARQDGDLSLEAAPCMADWRAAGQIRHTFTHFHLELIVYRASWPSDGSGPSSQTSDPGKGWWGTIDKLNDEALPNLMRKVIACAL